MKITKENYYSEISLIGLKNLPQELQEMHELINELTTSGSDWKNYDADKDLQGYCQVQFEAVEKWISKNTKQEKTADEITPGNKNNEHNQVYIDIQRKKNVVIDVTTNKKWANEYFKNRSDALEFIKQNGLTLIEKPQQTAKQAKKWKPKFKPGDRVIWTGSSGKHEGVIISVDTANRGTYLFKGDTWDDADNINEKNIVKAKKAKKAKQPKSKKQFPAADEVTNIAKEIKIIKRFANLHGDTIGKTDLMKFIRFIQTPILTGEIKKTSPYAEQIMSIQKFLVNTYKEMDGNTIKIEIDEKRLAEMKSIGHSQVVMTAIQLIKKFLSLYPKISKPKGRTDARKLLNDIELSVGAGKVPDTNPYFNEVEFIYAAVSAFANGKKFEIKDYQLNGLNGVCNCLSGLGAISKKKTKEKVIEVAKNPFPYVGAFTAGVLSNLAANFLSDGIKNNFVKNENNNIKGLNGPVSSEELSEMKFNYIGLTGKWRKLIGDPQQGFSALIFGLPKNGKSTMAIEFAGHLARNNGRVLYCAIEEGYGATLNEKFTRLNATHPRLSVCDRLLADYSDYDFVFIDSVSKAGLSAEECEQIKKENSDTSFIFVFHTTKDGKFRGSQQFAHNQDILIEVNGGVAKANGRYAPENEMNIFDKTNTLKIN